MPTEAAIGRLKSAFVVLSSIDEFRGQVLPKLAARPAADDQPPVNHGDMLDYLRGQLVFAYNNLFKKDFDYTLELADDQKYFDEREETNDDLRQVMIDSRGLFVHLYRPANVEEYGFPGTLDRDPEGLYQQGRHLDQRLRQPDLEPPKAWTDKVVIGPVTLADEVSPLVEKLGTVLEHVRRERKEATTAQQARNAALDAFDNTFLWVSRTCESLFNLAGEKELAKRVRPSASRPGRTEQDPDSSLDETGQPPPDFNEADPEEPLPGSDDPAGGAAPPPPITLPPVLPPAP